jgi:prolyl-tRNA synthetase
VATPNRRTIEEVADFLGVPREETAKTMVYTDGQRERVVMVLVRGDRQVNEVKLRAALGWPGVELAGDEAIASRVGPVGYLGPVGWKGTVLVDAEVAAMGAFITGANEPDAHLRGVLFGRDFTGDVADVRSAGEGDPCARCESGRYRAFRGIEVGHVFFLGTKYAAPMKCAFLDADGKEKVMPMGCYGIGITRIAAAAIEQNHDADGIVWPMPIAPFHVIIVPAGKEAEVVKVAEDLERELQMAQVEVLFDDRDERPGVKFKDADLLGVPIRVTVGKKGLAEGIVEVRRRKGGEMTKVKIDEAAATVRRLVDEGLMVAPVTAEEAVARW